MAGPASSPAVPLFLALVFAAASLCRGARAQWEESDLVTTLPGQPPVGFRHFAGYVGARPGDAKELFYWFFEAEGGAGNKPLVLWLNGGRCMQQPPRSLSLSLSLSPLMNLFTNFYLDCPGCSSIAYGAAQELGPFLVRSNGPNLTLNAYSWNKGMHLFSLFSPGTLCCFSPYILIWRAVGAVANLLFLEAPVGVGFSYTNKTVGLEELGDRVTAQDSHAFLLNWFKKFPRFRSHDFYIAGESYAGHYVPQLAELIHEGNTNASRDSYINFKGFMIGNAVINDETDQLGMVDYAWSHAIISDQLYHAVHRDCSDFNGSATGKACSSAVKAFLQAYTDIDIYSIYTPVCLGSPSQRPKSLIKAKKILAAAPRTFSDHEFRYSMRPLPRAGYDPCTEDYVEKYFNREDVQRALHANLTNLSYPYTPCSAVIQKWNDSPSTVLPIIRKLLDAGLRIWIYSGDTDGRVPVTSTRYSVNAMGLTVEEEWRAWYHKRQVAGWVVEYRGGLTLATLRGAGHQVPVLAPDRSLSLISHFLAGKRLPSARR
ncbi:hypothetical protein Taro_052994 [Colocasia esculenta]|uniref:Carboxypeptidase n=1 Tax=Colocasia esculenta TaxID=4460 RepID=A0A843XLH4_COLES|nr:hypothetical protein [Colocasia esculenta]